MQRLYFTIILLLCANIALASTIGIATGNKTVDGRPLLFKNKDRTDNYPSDVNFYNGTSDGYYSYVFQQNDGQNHERARMGLNEAGFGIVYSTSENLEGAETGPYGSQFAAMALKTCASLEDFRDLLESTAGERRVHEHFGVIDSSGAGSLFEVDGYSHVEIPIIDSIGTMANTAKYHPSAGAPASGSTSPDREARATYLLTHGPNEGLSYRYFIDEIIKDFSHTQEDEDRMPLGQYYTNPVLSRYKTAAGAVIRGIKPGDKPQIISAMWLCLSEPSLSVALPFFTNISSVPYFIRSSSEGDGMAGSSDRLRRLVYSYANGRYGDRYADTFMLLNIREHTYPIQDSLFTAYERNLPLWLTQSDQEAKQNMSDWMYDIQLWAKTKYDSIGILLPIADKESFVTDTFLLMQNFPNPFNGHTVIPFILRRKEDVKITVYNTLGQKIWSWSRSRLNRGFHELRFPDNNALNKPIGAGVYIYRLRTASGQQTRKMIYLP